MPTFVAVCATTWVASCAHAPFCKVESEVYPETPFTLDVKLGSDEATIGGRLSVEYVLSNVASVPVGACVEGWDEHHFIGTSGNKGLVHASFDGVPLASVVRLAPGTSLIWRREVEVPDVGAGPARFVGIFSSRCWLWSGTVKSEAVDVNLVTHR